MKLLRQMYRRPVKLLLNTLLVALAALIFIASIGQYASTALTRLHLDDSYSTIALRSPWGRRSGNSLLPEWPQAVQELKQDLLKNHSDMVLGESYSGLYSMYAPALQFDNFSNHEIGNEIGDEIAGMCRGYPYRDAMLVVRLEKIGTIENVEEVVSWDSTGTQSAYALSRSILCSAVIEQVVGLADSYGSPVGKNITLSIHTANGSTAPDLAVGQSYLIYGRDYLNIHCPEQEHLRRTEQAAELYGAMQDSADYFAALDQVGAMLTIRDQSAEPVVYRGENGTALRWDLRKAYVLQDGKVFMGYADAGEFVENYRVPTIAHLTGTVADFLNAPEGALWKKALEEMEIHNHSFPVMGVENLNYQSSFSQGEAYLVDGRAFTTEEVTEGQKVCVISDALAQLNGLQVGDSISMQAVTQDPNLWNLTGNNPSLTVAHPSAAYYSRAMGFETQMESYTIVGIYHYTEAWQTDYRFNPDTNEYDREGSVSVFGYTTNTIFVPKTAVKATPVLHEDGIFHSLIIKNGMMEEFQAYLKEQGHRDVFLCRDGGYSQIVADLDAYEGVSQSILLVGLLGGVALLALFVALQPLQNRKNVHLLGSLGATRMQRIGYLCANGGAPLIMGTAAGAALGSLLWGKVAAGLMASVEVSIPLAVDSGQLAIAVAGAQILVTVLLILLMSIACSGNRNLMKRK